MNWLTVDGRRLTIDADLINRDAERQRSGYEQFSGDFTNYVEREDRENLRIDTRDLAADPNTFIPRTNPSSCRYEESKAKDRMFKSQTLKKSSPEQAEPND